MVRRALLGVVGIVVLVAAGCVTNPGGDPGVTTTTTTTISTGPPVAVAGASPTIGDAPLTVHFDSSGSQPGTGTDLTYSWDFGDGSPADSGTSPTHVYSDCRQPSWPGSR